LSLMVEETNKNLVREGKAKTTKGELLKWFGILLLITRFEFGDRAALWATSSRCKYIPTPNFGDKTGMTRDRFHVLFKWIVWSVQPPQRPEGMSSEAYRWMLIEDFISNFNEHRAQYFHPGWQICADESMSRWYGLGGHWINMGLPMYVAMDRKPEDGMEIQNACCACSNIMYQLKLVKTAQAHAEEE
jgi:Transposase IS4